MRKVAIGMIVVLGLVAGGLMLSGRSAHADHPGSQPIKSECDPGIAHVNMLPTTDIQPDPLFTKNPPAQVIVTWTFNRAIADTIPLHGLQFISLTGPGGLNAPATKFGPVTNGDMTVEIHFSGAAVGAALTTLLAGGATAQASLTVTADWSAQPHLFDISENICPVSATGKDTIQAANPPPDEQINIHVNLKTGGKLEGTCWRVSSGPAKVQHDVVGDDTGGVKPDCGEPSNVKLFDEDPAPGVLLITITSAQRVQFGDIWHVQHSFSQDGNLDPNNFQCDLSQGKCTIPKVAVGGLSVDLAGDETGLPLEATRSSGGYAGLVTGIAAAVAAGAVALGGAAWCARRRWLR